MRKLRVPIVLALLGAVGLIIWGADAVACRWRWRQRCSSCPIAMPVAVMPDAAVIQMPYVPGAEPPAKNKMPFADEDKQPQKKMPEASDPAPPKRTPLEVLLEQTAAATTLPDPAAAMILVAAPDGAQVYLDNHHSRQTTSVRSFHTPPLAAGNYVCEARVEWDVNGVRVRQTKTIPIRPGQIAEVVFHEGELIAQAQGSAPVR